MYISKDSLYVTNGTTESTILTSSDSDFRNAMSNLTALTNFQIGTCAEEDIDTIKNITIAIVGLDDSAGGGNTEETTSIANIKLGDTAISELYLGSTQIVKVCLGDTVIYEL